MFLHLQEHSDFLIFIDSFISPSSFCCPLISQHQTKLFYNTLHFSGNRLYSLFRFAPVLSCNSIRAGRTYQDFSFRIQKLIIHKRSSRMIGLTAEQGFFHLNFMKIRHLPGKNSIFISKRRLVFLQDCTSLASWFLHKYCFKKFPNSVSYIPS